MQKINQVSLRSESGVANIIIAIFSSVFVASMILPLAAYHQNSLRAYTQNKAKLESIENLERASKAVVVSYQSSPINNRSISSIGTSSNSGVTQSGRCGTKSKWEASLFCFEDNQQTVGAQFVKISVTGHVAGIDSAQTISPTGASASSSNTGTSPSGTIPPREYPTGSYSGGGSDGGSGGGSKGGTISQPIRYPITQPITHPVEIMDNRNYPGSESDLSWDEKLFLMADAFFPQTNAPENSLFSSRAFAAVASGVSPASGPELGMGQLPSQWLSYNPILTSQVRIDYPATPQAADLLLSCADTSFRCFEIRICPSNIQASGGCTKESDFFKQQVLLYN